MFGTLANNDGTYLSAEFRPICFMPNRLRRFSNNENIFISLTAIPILNKKSWCLERRPILMVSKHQI